MTPQEKSQCSTEGSWRIDETYIKVRGKRAYLWGAPLRHTVDGGPEDLETVRANIAKAVPHSVHRNGQIDAHALERRNPGWDVQVGNVQ